MGQSKRIPSISIAIPASFVADTPHLREKTFRIGLISRASAIFRVNEIIVFRDLQKKNQNMDMELIASILSYMETPQYLRKCLFPFKPILKYVGILPPLRTPHHPLSKFIKNLNLNEYREGVIIKSDEKASYVDIGVERPVLLQKPNLPIGKRITVKVIGLDNIPEITIVENKEINIYWGYRVSFSNSTLGQIIKEGNFDLVIMTSRYGKPLTEVIVDIKKRWKQAVRVIIAFGSPSEGLREILAHEGLEIKKIADLTINVILGQGTETVRTEEAIYATLSAINLII